MSDTVKDPGDSPQTDGKAAVQISTKGKEKTAVEAKMAAVMYIGPNQLNEGLKKYTVYKDGAPPIMEVLKEKYPQIERLFVNIDKLNGALAAATQAGTPVFLAYKEVEGE